MNPVKKILFPTDFSEASHYALAYAVEMKKILNAELEIVHILFDEGNIVAFYIPQMGMPMQNLSPDFEDGARKQFDEFVANAPELKDVEFTTKILRGNPYSEIIKEAENGNFDMIIIGTHGRTGLEHVLFGSTAELVVRKAPCPVLTVRPKGTQEA